MKKVFFCLLMVAGIAYSSFYEAPAKRISVNLGVLKDFNYTERIIDGKTYEINGIQRITDDYIYLENYKNGKQLRVDNLGEFSFSENQRAEDINRGFYIKNKDILKKGGSVEVVNIKSDNSEELVGTINQKYLDMYIKNKESGLILSDINGIKVEGEKSYIVIEFDITDTDSQKKFYVYEGYKYISYVMVIDLQTKKIYDEEFEINDRILSNIIYYDKYKDGLFQLENGNIVNELILNDDSTITKKQKGVLNNREHLVITKNSNEEFAVVDEEFIAVKKRSGEDIVYKYFFEDESSKIYKIDNIDEGYDLIYNDDSDYMVFKDRENEFYLAKTSEEDIKIVYKFKNDFEGYIVTDIISDSEDEVVVLIENIESGKGKIVVLESGTYEEKENFDYRG